MNTAPFIVIAILLPILAGLYMFIFKVEDRKSRQTFVSVAVIISSICAMIAVLFTGDGEQYKLIQFSEKLSISVHVDGLTKVFASIVALLWVPSTFYSLEYMKHEGQENRFFSFFLMSQGVALGVAFAANPLTLYLFYEFLTLATTPLVMHSMDDKARSAGKKYIAFSMSGAAMGFLSIMFLLMYSGDITYTMGGTMDPANVAGNETFLRLAYLFGFFGFGVKAAVFPCYAWLTAASVAPTPVSALLHAVAVVKSGVFAVIRLTYYGYGTELLQGSFAQVVGIIAALITILLGSTLALRTPHLKRRLAYSSVSNLSYMIFSAMLLSGAGLVGAMTHMIAHAVIKITLFFCAGAIIYKTGNEYVYQLEGYGKRMPIVMATFTISGLGLIGLPPFGGFMGKWMIGTAAMSTGTVLGYIGVGVLIVSALLTLLYQMTTIIPAYFPRKSVQITDNKDPNKLMTVPLIILCILQLIMPFFGSALVDFLQGVFA